jgi:hypothetical protein
MNKLILFLKHGNPDRPVMRRDVIEACSLFLLMAAVTAPFHHILSGLHAASSTLHLAVLFPTLCMGGALLLAFMELYADDEDNGHALARRVH